MRPWKLPPPIKVYEAMGAIGDGRVRAVDDDAARSVWEVVSSDASKTYRVELSADGREVSSNDNASYWQGYLGYPAIAVLIARGTLRASPGATRLLAGIPWKELNRRHRSGYEQTMAEVARIVRERGGDFDAIAVEAVAIIDALAALDLQRGARPRPPAAATGRISRPAVDRRDG